MSKLPNYVRGGCPTCGSDERRKRLPVHSGPETWPCNDFWHYVWHDEPEEGG